MMNVPIHSTQERPVHSFIPPTLPPPYRRGFILSDGKTEKDNETLITATEEVWAWVVATERERIIKYNSIQLIMMNVPIHLMREQQWDQRPIHSFIHCDGMLDNKTVPFTMVKHSLFDSIYFKLILTFLI